MRVLLYLNQIRSRMGGGSLAMWSTLEALAQRGCEVRVAARAKTGEARVRDHPVSRIGNRELFQWADIVLTGTGRIARHACSLARLGGRARVVEFVHSAISPEAPAPTRADLVVWASEAIRDFARAQGWGSAGPELVMWPPLHAERYRVEPGECVTLINLLPEKGGDLFWSLARALPDVRFLGVEGGWGRQAIPADGEIPPNVELLPYQTDPREVYRRTRILLYPRGESAGPGWLHGVGMAALEAACSGIPTIAYPGPGLRESLGDAAVWVGSTEPERWADAIRALVDNLGTYAAASAAARERAAALDPDGDVDRLFEALGGSRNNHQEGTMRGTVPMIALVSHQVEGSGDTVRRGQTFVVAEAIAKEYEARETRPLAKRVPTIGIRATSRVEVVDPDVGGAMIESPAKLEAAPEGSAAAVEPRPKKAIGPRKRRSSRKRA